MIDEHSRGARTREEYLALRRMYEPLSPSLVIVAESPPVSGLYFYDPSGLPTEPLFSALMRQLKVSVTSKENGLLELQRRGWILVDATYTPVDKLTSPARDAVIEQDYPQLRDDIRSLIGDQSIPVALLKANVCRVLNQKLSADGFNVINRGQVIPFPSTGWQTEFHKRFADLLVDAGLI